MTHCEYPGDLSDNCITCDSAKVYILPTDGSCLNKCTPTFYEVPLINQCRPCDTTCYTCTGTLATHCTSCTGLLYFNYLANTCVPVCEAVGLTMSLTRSNVCVVFDANAQLVNVAVGVPIDINTFTFITALVVGATAPGYSTLWGFDSAKTITANNNNPLLVLGLTPFTGDISQLTTPLDHTFFQLSFKYVFYLEIIKANGASKVIVRVDFTLTMNASPSSGRITVVPPVGLYNTTIFVITCDQWTDDSTTNLQYHFYSIEDGTSTAITLSPWSSVNEIYTSFKVIYYQQASSKIKLYCEVKDQYNAKTVVSTSVTIANSLSGGIFSIANALSTYTFPATITDSVLLSRSEFLKSLAQDLYKTLQPDPLQTTFDPSLDQSIITKKDPSCTPDYCNSNGYCDLVDLYLVCHCDLGFIGTNCQVDKTGYTKLQASYDDLYSKVFSQLQTSITDDQFHSLHNLFAGAALFSQDATFFSSKLDTFLTMAFNLFQSSITANAKEYIDLFDYYYSFEVNQLNQLKLNNKNSTGYPYRNITLTDSEQTAFATSFNYIIKKLTSFLQILVTQNKNTQKTISYESKNFQVTLTTINPSFSDTNFFKTRIAQYQSYVKFMKCLNYIEIEKLSNPYYQAWMMFIEFYNSPLSYNSTLYANNTSPLILLKFYDDSTGKEILISNCTGDNALEFYLPFNSFTYIDSLNEQKWLYDPKNYKSPNDSVFSDPIYINATGFVSNDTVETRIRKYNRLYNFSCSFYNETMKDYSSAGVNYTNFTSDSNYIVFQSSHLTQFTTFFVENNMTFKVQSRFFYLSRPQLFIYWPNYLSNYAFYIIAGFVGLHLLLVFILSLYDNQFFQQESLLEFLKREIVKVQLPYNSNKDVEADKIVVNTGFMTGMIFDKNLPPATANNFFPSQKITAGIERSVGEDDSHPQILTLNKFGNEEEREMDNVDVNQKDSQDEDFEAIRKRKVNNRFYNESNNEQGEPVINNPFFNEGDKINLGNAGTKNNMIASGTILTQERVFETLNVNQMPKKFEDEEIEYQNRLDAFAGLNLTFGQFVCHNLKERHVFLSPIINISLFNPRWKKMTLLVTENAIIMIMLSIQMTADEKVSTQNIALLVKVSFLSVLTSNAVMYIIAFFFVFSSQQRRRLYKLVISGGQLIVLKEWEELMCSNVLYTFFGLMLNIVFWGMGFYFSVAFVAVWTSQALSWLICFIIAFVMDFVILELLYEFFIGVLYLQRKKGNVFRVGGEFINRSRNYRCLWP